MVEAVIVLVPWAASAWTTWRSCAATWGWQAILGYELPAPSTLRSWLESFHDEAALAGRPAAGAFIPAETPRLEALRTVLNHTVRSYVAAMAPAVR